MIVAILRRITTQDQAAPLAAGPFWTILDEHGPKLLPRIERLARHSPRLRYLLTGYMPQGQDVSPTRARLLAAGQGPRFIGDAGPLPPIDD
ncbi:hypothetical protein NX862_12595 [Rhodobacter sp. KR11]|uniref:DUF6869 domain-containing protein n=1 Tax=Rhodobacter sp. KR11 TaxID=2974588 RepID=UPI0022219622|nr:hypothetical protein [Rhodobacter sp. KR11]MCW1919595.1 hypothetical protein [Rhodobacter sp. KR11]